MIGASSFFRKRRTEAKLLVSKSRETANIMRSILLALLLSAAAITAQAQLMTIQQLKDLLQRGTLGELGATSYVQGVVDGMLAMETMRRNGSIRPREFCKLMDAIDAKQKIGHPSSETKQVVEAWERTGKPMDTIAVDVVLSYLSGRYGCW
jgi:hypothetical protein